MIMVVVTVVSSKYFFHVFFFYQKYPHCRGHDEAAGFEKQIHEKYGARVPLWEVTV